MLFRSNKDNKDDPNKDDKNKDKEQNKQQQPKDQKEQMSKEQAKQMLEAMKNNESDLQKKIRKMKMRGYSREKDW